jgi:hypothetical protein
MCYALRLHMSAAPPRVGLTQALGGRKAVCSFVVRGGGSSASVGVALRTQLGAFFFDRVRLARSHIACVAFAGFGNSGWLMVGLFAPDTVASVTPGGEFSGRARAPGLRFSASASGLGSHRHPSPPNNSFKPTPHRGVGHVPALR